MFATPRAGAESHRGSGTRRALQIGSVSRSTQLNSPGDNNETPEPECPSEAPAGTNSDILTILRSLQQQVSSLQAQQQQQQQQATQAQAESSIQLPKRTTPNKKRKMPRELVVM